MPVPVLAARQLTAARAGLGVVLVLGFFSVVFRVAEMHSETRDWGITAAGVPTKLSFQGRHYLRGSRPVSAAELVSNRGTDAGPAGGGEIYVPLSGAGSAAPTPTGLIVATVDGLYHYSLMGGP